MPRGITPRRPARTGSHEGIRTAPKVGNKPATPLKKAQPDYLPPKASKQKTSKQLKGYDPVAPERVSDILKRLDQLYPAVTCALTHQNAWELLVATILSAQSTDVRVNMVTPELFNKYPTVQDFVKLEPQQLEPDIRSTGFFRNKSKSVVGAAKTKNDDPKKIEEDLMRVIPREKWILFSHQVIWHGRKLCIARSPKCADCALENICHAEDKTWSMVEKHPGAKA